MFERYAERERRFWGSMASALQLAQTNQNSTSPAQAGHDTVDAEGYDSAYNTVEIFTGGTIMNAGKFSRRQMLEFAAVTGAAAIFVKPASAQAPTRKIDSMDSALDAIISTSEPIRILGEGYGGDGGPAEGPVWWKEGGYLLFSDIGNNRRMKYTPGQGITVFKQ